MNLHWFMRMAQWVRNPPSAKRVKLVFAVLAIVLVIVAAERLGWWPDGLTAQKIRF